MGIKEVVPSGANIVACIELCTDAAMLMYLKDGLTKKLTAARAMQEYAPMLKNIDELIDYHVARERRLLNADPFAGDIEGVKANAIDAYNYQDFIGEEAIKQLDTSLAELNLNHVDFVYNISDDSVFTRAYIANGETLNDETSEILDNGFNAWLDERGMYSAMDDSTRDVNIYYKPKNGEMSGRKVPPQDFSSAIENKEKGPQQKIQTLDKSIQVTVHEINDYVNQNKPQTGAGS